MNLERANWTLEEGRDWHVAWFRECLRIIDTFTQQSVLLGHDWRDTTNNQATFEKGTNLCHYVRVMMVWGPGIIFLHLLTVGLVMGALFFMPLQAMGSSNYLTLCSIVTAAGILMFGCYQLADWADTTGVGGRFGDWLDLRIGDPAYRASRRTKKYLRFNDRGGVSIWSLIWTFIVTLKRQVCPLIKIKEKE